MAVDKGKVKAALDAKFKGKSVSKELKEAYATRWADRIETEDDIAQFIADREDDVLDAAREADRRATTAAAKARQDAADAAAGKKPESSAIPETPKVPDDTPEYMKAFMAQFTELSNSVKAIQQEKNAQTLQQKFLSHEKIKGIPKELLHGVAPKSDDEIDALAESTATRLAPIVQSLTAAGFEGVKPAPASNATPNGGDGKPNPAVLAYAEKQAKDYEQKQQTSKN